MRGLANSKTFPLAPSHQTSSSFEIDPQAATLDHWSKSQAHLYPTKTAPQIVSQASTNRLPSIEQLLSAPEAANDPKTNVGS